VKRPSAGSGSRRTRSRDSKLSSYPREVDSVKVPAEIRRTTERLRGFSRDRSTRHAAMDPGNSESLTVQLPSKGQLPLGMPSSTGSNGAMSSPRRRASRKSVPQRHHFDQSPSGEGATTATALSRMALSSHAPSAACPGLYAGRACAATELESAGPARPMRPHSPCQITCGQPQHRVNISTHPENGAHDSAFAGK
jgi:hypothetical protein